MMERILPQGLYCVSTVDLSSPYELLLEERELLQHASEKRRRDFSAGRQCARDAIGKMGQPIIPILADKNRMPCWPKGIVGSITHCHDYCAAAVAYQNAYLSIGIDAERYRTIDDRLLRYISLPEERDHLASLPAERNWRLLLFSAKESVYKSFYSIRLRRLHFHDVMIYFDLETSSFSAKLTQCDQEDASLLSTFEGRFNVVDDLYLTASWKTAEPPFISP